MAENKKIEELVCRINNLSIPNSAVMDLITLLDDPGSDFRRLHEKLTPDLTTEFLKMANSAYYWVEVRTIDHALKMLGYDTMKQFLVTSALADYFIHSSHLDKHFNLDKFYRMARFCCAVSRVIGDVVDYERPEELFTVAILHNLGKVIIAGYFNEEYREIEALEKSEQITESEAERRVLGITHAEIGGMVLSRFHIPADICSAVERHNLKEPVLEESNCELEMIIRVSITIIHDFELPEVDEYFELMDRLKGTIRKGSKLYHNLLRSEMRTKGHREVFPSALKQVSKIVHDDLKKILPEYEH